MGKEKKSLNDSAQRISRKNIMYGAAPISSDTLKSERESLERIHTSVSRKTKMELRSIKSRQ